MAVKTFLGTKINASNCTTLHAGQGEGDVTVLVEAVDTSIDAAEAAEVADLAAAIAAAQVIGAGDASAEVDAVDAAFQLLETEIARIQSEDVAAAISASGGVSGANFSFSFDTEVIETRNDLEAVLNSIRDRVANSGLLS